MISWPMMLGSVAGSAMHNIPAVVVDPTILALFNGGANIGTMINPNDRGTVFKNAAGTLIAEPGDYIELIRDQSGCGNDLHAEINSVSGVDFRPRLAEDNNGLRYLDFSRHISPGASEASFRDAYFNNNALMTSNLSACIDATAATSRVIMACPQKQDVHVTPYFRWSFWGGPTNLETRFNGTPYDWSLGQNASLNRVRMGFDTVNGKCWSEGSVVSTFPPVTLTYPNYANTKIVWLNRNGAGNYSDTTGATGERSTTMKAAAIFAINRGLSNAEFAMINAWMRHGVI